MLRKNLKREVGNRIRFEYAQIDCFSSEKTECTYGNRMIFKPTILLINLYTSFKSASVADVNVDHAWVRLYPTLLEMKLYVGDTISFTARPMLYEKVNKRGKIMVEVGIDTIFNVKFLSRPNINTKELSFDYYLEEMIWDKNMIVPDTYLQYYYTTIATTRNHLGMIEGIRDLAISS